nr:phosphoribosyltransferase family protein [Peptoniphilus ovalis]
MLKNNRCPICKTSVSRSGLCENCEELIIKNPPFNYDFLEDVDDIIIAANYFGVMRKLLLDFKFKNKMECADIIADLMAEALFYKGGFSGVMTFVPMHREKLKTRGFNHAEILAKKIAEKIDIEFVEVFKKTRATKDQHGLHKEERGKNLKDSFEVINYRDEIIIVDDIITTGSTISELARASKNAGIKKVTALIAATKIA